MGAGVIRRPISPSFGIKLSYNVSKIICSLNWDNVSYILTDVTIIKPTKTFMLGIWRLGSVDPILPFLDTDILMDALLSGKDILRSLLICLAE